MPAAATANPDLLQDRVPCQDQRRERARQDQPGRPDRRAGVPDGVRGRLPRRHPVLGALFTSAISPCATSATIAIVMIGMSAMIGLRKMTSSKSFFRRTDRGSLRRAGGAPAAATRPAIGSPLPARLPGSDRAIAESARRTHGHRDRPWPPS